MYGEYAGLTTYFNGQRDAAAETGCLCPSETLRINSPRYDVGARQCVVVGLFVPIRRIVGNDVCVWGSCKIMLFESFRVRSSYYCVIPILIIFELSTLIV